MQTDLVKIAHQLIETANLLIKAAGAQETVVHHKSGIQEIMHETDKEFFGEELKPSKRSQFGNRTEKIQHIKAQIQECETIISRSKNPKEVSEASRKLSAFRGHLTKAMNQPSVGGSTWKSRV